MVIREVNEQSLAEFVRQEIGIGYTALSRVISHTIELSHGRFFLVMPDGLVPERVEHWNWDPGHFKGQIADAILGRLIEAYLRASGNRVLIQDFEEKTSDPHFEDDPLLAFYGEEPYWELHRSDISQAKIQECIGNASYWPWLGYFCKTRARADKFLTDNDLHEVAAHLIGVGVQALHDSYVIWWRTDLEPFPNVQLPGE